MKESKSFRPWLRKVYPATYNGFMAWAGERVRIFNIKQKKNMPVLFNVKQKELYKNAFKLHTKNQFIHSNIYTSRPRGDYKTFDLALLCLFRFFNMPEEYIHLIKVSDRQSKEPILLEVFKILRDSPKLRNTPGLRIPQKAEGIYLMINRNSYYSSMETLKPSQGAHVNVTCVALADAWKVKPCDYNNIQEIFASICSVENAWTLAEGIVTPPKHFFTRAYKNRNFPYVYFQHYSDKNYNLRITKEYLKETKEMFPLQFNNFFRNRWKDAVER